MQFEDWRGARAWQSAPPSPNGEGAIMVKKGTIWEAKSCPRTLNRHSPDSCRVVRQFAPFPPFRQSCAAGAGCRWGWNEPASCRALKIAEFSVIEARLSLEFGSDA